jgi:uncharacterized membrane protein
MKPNKELVLSVIASAISAMLAGAAQAQQHPEKPTYKYEKCYGVVKAGHNDCFLRAARAQGRRSKTTRMTPGSMSPPGRAIESSAAIWGQRRTEDVTVGETER